MMTVDSEKKDDSIKLAEKSSHVRQSLLRKRARSIECLKRAEWSSNQH